MTIRYVAFLRGINVGGHKIIKMEALRRTFESWGLSNVSTFIQSGNVIFDSNKVGAQALESKVASQLAVSLGYPVGIFLRTTRALAAIAAHPPFDMAETDILYIAFLHARPTRAAQSALLALQNDVDELAVKGREAYWLRHRDLGESRLASNFLEKALGMPATARNMTSIRKIVEKYA
ncbi:MAG TPA: DUF1697 domain-containing protein [Anaerolineales bacterium]